MSKFVAKGTTITYNSIAVGNVRSITLPDANKEEVDVTDHGSAGIYREFLPGLADPGTVTLECNYNPQDAGQQALVTDFATAGNTARECVITLPSGASSSGTATITFDAFVQSKPGNLPGSTAEAATRTFSLRVTGASTEAIA